jgi:hypothetical protein
LSRSDLQFLFCSFPLIMANISDMPALVSDSDTSDSDQEACGFHTNAPRDSTGSMGGLGRGAASARHGATSAQAPPAQRSDFPGRSYHEFDSFPTDNIQECCICLNTPSDGQICQLHCSHVFHAGCIDTWLNDSNTCPTCRKVVDPQRVMPSPEDSFPPGFPRNMSEFAEMFFAFANPFVGPYANGPGSGPSASAAHSNPPSHPPHVEESHRRAAVDTLIGYLRSRFHVDASSAVLLERLANIREIWSSLPHSMTLRQIIDSQPDLFHVVRQGSALAVYVEPHHAPPPTDPLSQCTAAISSFLEARNHTAPSSALPLSVLCDVPSIRRSLPPSVTLSNVIRSSNEFVLIQSQSGSSVYRRMSPSSTSASHVLRATGSSPAGIARSTDSTGAAARASQDINPSWEAYAMAVHKHLCVCGFTSAENSLSLRLIGTVQHLHSLRDESFPPLLQLLSRFPRLLSVERSNGQSRVWAVTGFSLSATRVHCAFLTHPQRLQGGRLQSTTARTQKTKTSVMQMSARAAAAVATQCVT